MSNPNSSPFKVQLSVRFHQGQDQDQDQDHLLSVNQWLLHSHSHTVTTSRTPALDDSNNPWHNTTPSSSSSSFQPASEPSASSVTHPHPAPHHHHDDMYLALLSDRIHSLAHSISTTRSQIDSHRTLLAHTCTRLTSLALLSPSLQHAATRGVALALARTGNPDTLVTRARRAALHATAAPLGMGAAVGGATGIATGALVSGLLTMRMLARGLIGPAALAGLTGVGAAPVLAGVTMGGAVAAGAWHLGRHWARARHGREAEACVRQLRQDRDAMLLLQVAVASVHRELAALVAAVDQLGADEAHRLALADQALDRLARADLRAAHATAIQAADLDAWVAPCEAAVAQDGASESMLLLEDQPSATKPSSSSSSDSEAESYTAHEDDDEDNKVLIGSTTLAWSSNNHPTEPSPAKKRPTKPKPVQPPPEDASMAASWMLVSKLGADPTADATANAAQPATAAPVTPVVAPADTAQKEWAAL